MIAQPRSDRDDAKEGPRASIAFVLFSVHGFVRLSALAFGKFLERGGRIFFTYIWSAANRPERLVPKLANDDFALITLALADDIIILRHLWTVGIHIPAATRLQLGFGLCQLGELQHRKCGNDNG